jgi:D-glycero-D-manno-heptose 1,7-bisphosphate phosphatase
MSAQRPAVFLDKDGTVLKDVPYNVDPRRMQLASGVAEGLRALGRLDWPLIVVSNQAGVARGLFPEESLGAVTDELRRMFAGQGAQLHDLYYCPHDANGIDTRYAVRCTCRKPEPGMLLVAAREHRIDLARSWMVGDTLDDVEAGRRAGCRAILIDNGNETEWRTGGNRIADSVVSDFARAARIIVSSTEDWRRAAAGG